MPKVLVMGLAQKNLFFQREPKNVIAVQKSLVWTEIALVNTAPKANSHELHLTHAADSCVSWEMGNFPHWMRQMQLVWICLKWRKTYTTADENGPPFAWCRPPCASSPVKMRRKYHFSSRLDRLNQIKSLTLLYKIKKYN